MKILKYLLILSFVAFSAQLSASSDAAAARSFGGDEMDEDSLPVPSLDWSDEEFAAAITQYQAVLKAIAACSDTSSVNPEELEIALEVHRCLRDTCIFEVDGFKMYWLSSSHEISDGKTLLRMHLHFYYKSCLCQEARLKAFMFVLAWFLDKELNAKEKLFTSFSAESTYLEKRLVACTDDGTPQSHLVELAKIYCGGSVMIGSSQVSENCSLQ